MITIEIHQDYTAIDYDSNRIEQLLRRVCERFERTEGVISLALLSDEQMIELNQHFMQLETTTDCFSFDLSDETEQGFSFEIIVNAQLAMREAGRRGHSAEAELALYVVHGLLHNIGYDDLTEEEARKMHRMEDEILECFGYGTVYNSRAN